MTELPYGLGMYLMMIFLAVAVIGMIMAIKNRIAHNKVTDLVKDDKLRDQLHDIERLQKRPQKDPQTWDNTTIDLGKGKGDWEKYKKPKKDKND